MQGKVTFRAIEMHGHGMWDRSRIVRAIGGARALGLNGLVIHESDIVHQLVYPRAYFDPYALWSDAPSRRGENALFNNRIYFQHVLDLAAEAGIEVWINAKEIAFSDEVLGLHPEVIKGGVFCPSEPFWMEYIESKTDELFSDFPGLAGLIVSMGSQESRTARSQNKCQCERCRSESLEDWYSAVVAALHGPIARHGKQLAIRDFAYKPSDHTPLIEAVRKSAPEVIFCLKAMPHDFYVTFPDNPAIGALQRRQWVEYDVMGQFFGWGVMPCLVLDDIRKRLLLWEENDVSGVILRIEWERINDLDCFDNLSETNLIAAAALIGGEMIDTVETCRRFLAGKGWDVSAADWLASILDATLPIVRSAAYINGFVSADNSMLPRSIARAWWGAESRDSLAVWAHERAADLNLDRDRLQAYLAEKETALEQASKLVERVLNYEPGLDPRVHRYVQNQFEFFETWIEGLKLAADVCLYARWLSTSQNLATPSDVDALERSVGALTDYASRVRTLARPSEITHHIRMLVDDRRAEDVAREGATLLRELRAAPRGFRVAAPAERPFIGPLA